MELTPAQLANIQTIIFNSSKVRLDNLAVGQEVLAKVISTTPDGDITLNINNAILNAKTALALSEGQLLKLLVAQTGKQVVLQLPQSMVHAALSQQLLRENLPKQQPLNHTVQLLQQVLKQADQLQLPPRVQHALQNFVQRLPSTQQLSDPKSLQQAIKNSGLFLEKSITQELEGQGKVANNDLKVLLSQLRNTLVSERAVLSQQPQPATEQKAQATATLPLTPQTQQAIKQDLPQTITAQTILQQSIGSKTAPQTTTPATTSQTGSLPPGELKASVAQVETALNIKAAQTAIKPLTQSSLPISELTPPVSPTLGKPLLQVPGQYQTSRHASTIKEALAINTNPATAGNESASVSRFGGLIELMDQLIRQVESSVARTQLHQLNSLQDQDAGRMVWSLEIPVKQDNETHLVQLEIEKETAKHDGEAVVTVNLAVNLEYLGPVYSRITLTGKNVSVVFWAEQERTFGLTRDALPNLETSLQKSGFNTPKINCHHGQPPQLRQAGLPMPDKLLDIKV